MDDIQKAVVETIERTEGYKYFKQHVIDFYDANFDHNYNSVEELHDLTFFRLAAGFFNMKNKSEFVVVIPEAKSEAFHQGMRHAQKDFQEVIDYWKKRSNNYNKMRMNW